MFLTYLHKSVVLLLELGLYLFADSRFFLL